MINTSFCFGCGIETPNPKFCSRRCAAITNNKLFPKRKRIQKSHPCERCGTEVKLRFKKCAKCRGMDIIQAYGNRLLKDFISKYPRHRYQKVRNHAHGVAEMHGLQKCCAICGYEVYVELCHKQSIGSFDKETSLSIVNHIDNLVYLCPNHHKELDLNILKLKAPCQ